MNLVGCLFFQIVFNLSLFVSTFAQTKTNEEMATISTNISDSNFFANQIHKNNSEEKINDIEKYKIFQTFRFNTTKKNLKLVSFKLTSVAVTHMLTSLINLWKFKVIKIYFNNRKNEFEIDYMISTNLTDLNQKPHLFKISFNCTSVKNEIWSRKKNHIFKEKKHLKESVVISPLNRESLPTPGSLIRCISVAESKNFFHDETIYYFIGKSI